MWGDSPNGPSISGIVILGLIISAVAIAAEWLNAHVQPWIGAF